MEPGYAIRGGTRDAERLARQARVMAEATEAFLARAGVRAGWSCLDVGSGDGQVTIHLARAVGLRGRVVGVDADEGALEIARRAAVAAGVDATFLRADAADPPERDFDLAFARLLLSHLADPMAAIRAMRNAVRPGGVVAIEDLDTGTVRAIPPAPVLGRLAHVYGATVRRHGGDPTIGPRLPALFEAALLEGVAEQMIANPMRTAEEKVFLVELLDNMREAIVAAGAATHGQVDALRAALDAAVRDPGVVFCQAVMHQVHGRRPAG